MVVSLRLWLKSGLYAFAIAAVTFGSTFLISNYVSEKQKESPEPAVIPSPTSTPAVKGATTTKSKPIVDANPVVNCNFTYLPDQQMKSSECSKSFECQIGSQWYIYTSQEKCDQDQAALSNSGGSGVNTITCNVYYPFSNTTYTYQLSPDDCSNAQERAKTIQTYTAPTYILTPYVSTYPTIPPPSEQVTIQQCLNRAQSTYDSAKSDCRNIARANGALSSSWYNQCVQTATDNYIYEKGLCN